MQGIHVRISVRVLLIALLLPLTNTFAAECSIPAAKIVSAQGNIEAKRSGVTRWVPARRNDTFCPGDVIRVGDHSRAAIALANETLLRLDQNSAIKLTQFKTNLPSILEFIRGIGHFISRVPRSLKIETATVNAAIEGTEFVVAISANETSVTVFEGVVLAQNQQGEVHITDGESVISTANAAPVKKLLARPRDTVQWALYFPPILEKDKPDKLSKASDLLYVGRVKEAQALLEGIDNGEALALKAIIAIVNNEKDRAIKFATDAIQQAPRAAAAHIATSYAWQAKLDLEQALTSMQLAIKYEPDNAIAWARIAEIQLSIGELDDALSSAKQATRLNANLSRTQSILAYAHLVRIDIEEAIATFNKAIELDQVDPLPRLGLGLAKIRKNKLKEGRREIEIAASLDPNNALIRSYLGKAYFEEKRGPLDAIQFAMAKQLDPNDPTSYYYDAIRKQTENNPIGALEDLNKSIELNDNRAVYRSSLQLDQDEAARSAIMAGIYQDLGLQQVAKNDAIRSLENDPSNHSAHLFLANAYANRQRYETAQASEMLQAQMLQPLGITALQPQITEFDLDTVKFAHGFGFSASDLSSMFTRDGGIAQINIYSGNNNTYGDEFSFSGLYDNVTISAAQYAFRNDGFRPNNDITHDIYNFFVQTTITNSLTLQAEYLDRSTDKGDMDLVFNADFNPGKRTTIDSTYSRLGLSYKPESGHTVVGSFIKKNTKDVEEIIASVTIPFPIVQTTTLDENIDSSIIELQNIYTNTNYNITSGIMDINVDYERNETVRTDFPPVIGVPVPDYSEHSSEHESFYTYLSIGNAKDLELTLGLTYDHYESPVFAKEKLNPKLGAKINITDNASLRLASFRLIDRPLISGQTIEPTHFTGFNQFFEDIEGSEIIQHNIALEIKESDKLYLGFRSFFRDIDVPVIILDSLSFDDIQETNHELYLSWIYSDLFSLSLEAYYENFENNDILITYLPNKLTTKVFPVSFVYNFTSGISARITPTFVDQNYVNSSNISNHDSFWIADFALGYKFNRRRGSVSLGAKNIFDKDFNYHNLNYTGENNEPRFIPGILLLVKLNLTFD